MSCDGCAVTILNERYRTLNGGATPKASLVKALLCNAAEDLGNAGPDYTFGFGNRTPAAPLKPWKAIAISSA